MSTFNPGTGGTYSCTSPEQMLYALINFGLSGERNSIYNPSNVNYISGTEDTQTLILTATLNIPVSLAISSTGAASLVVKDYLTNSGYIPGTDGDLKSTNWVACLLELIWIMINLEENITHNPNNYRMFTGNFSIPVNTNGQGTFNVTITMQLQQSVDASGNTTTSAKVVFS